jgi:hypothetical protein
MTDINSTFKWNGVDATDISIVVVMAVPSPWLDGTVM